MSFHLLWKGYFEKSFGKTTSIFEWANNIISQRCNFRLLFSSILLTPIQWSKSFPSVEKNYSSKEQEEYRKMQLHQYFHPFWKARGVQKNVIAPIYSSNLRSMRSLEKCNCTDILIHSNEKEEFRKMQLNQHFHPFQGARGVWKNAIAPICSSIPRNKKRSEQCNCTILSSILNDHSLLKPQIRNEIHLIIHTTLKRQRTRYTTCKKRHSSSRRRALSSINEGSTPR